ncbi:hypothetical protein AZE42_07232 [Rhizopogon vesiculosus]|uniref:Uncharacterized protein n=1 Tax=Rhizopogon vesiculosus TaxID=180088 RepID=A0A1J8R3S5_9AGAM|nr:hypothetical protein AZE42_07232 [Rhizopogon vesiculosus]
MQIFASTPTTVSRYLHFSLAIPLYALKKKVQGFTYKLYRKGYPTAWHTITVLEYRKIDLLRESGA